MRFGFVTVRHPRTHRFHRISSMRYKPTEDLTTLCGLVADNWEVYKKKGVENIDDRLICHRCWWRRVN